VNPTHVHASRLVGRKRPRPRKSRAVVCYRRRRDALVTGMHAKRTTTIGQYARSLRAHNISIHPYINIYGNKRRAPVLMSRPCVTCITALSPAPRVSRDTCFPVSVQFRFIYLFFFFRISSPISGRKYARIDISDSFVSRYPTSAKYVRR